MASIFTNPASCGGPLEPTPAGFLVFLRTVVGVPMQALPDGSPIIGAALEAAQAVVSLTMRMVSPPSYVYAVYNLAADTLINLAPDQDDECWFSQQRQKYKLDGLAFGVMASGSDEGTSASLLTPDFLKNLTLANLQQIKTPWGRAYLAAAQSVSTVWGLT